VKAVRVPEPGPEVKVVRVPEPEPEVKVVRVPEPGPEVKVVRVPEPGPEVKVVRVPEPGVEPEPLSPSTGPITTMPDPSDYAVHDGRVTVQAAETLGHYAEWLEIRASQLRARNRMRYEQPLVIGRRVRLDFSRVTPEEFERRRLEHHRTLQSEYFAAFEVTGTETHVLRRGESLWYLAERKYRIPIWLLRQYNPELDFANLPAGGAMLVPLVEPRTS
jgi:membrane-bound lytic murein transglycosylase D